MSITAAELDDLAAGAAFLATGGGGDPYVATLATRAVLDTHGAVELIKVADVRDDAFVAAIGGVGAPTVSLELLPSIDDPARALRAFEEQVGRKVDALVSFEVGGGNSMIPLMAAAYNGIPVIDGDGMGRALPEAQMMSYAIAGVSPTPAIALDYAGNTCTLNTDTTLTYERHIRALAQAMGGMITTVEHPMSGAELKSSIVPGTISFSIKLGRLLREKRGSAHQMLPLLKPLFEGPLYGSLHHLYTGKVANYESRIIGGYDVGEARIEPFSNSTGATRDALTVSVKNEYLLARLGPQVIASVPDLITIVDFETSEPINAERLRYGQRVTVIGVGCPGFYRSTNALQVVSPNCFGFDEAYSPIEQFAEHHLPI